MSHLEVPPARDEVLGGEGRIGARWLKWLNALREESDTNIHAVEALAVRVTTLEATVPALAATVAAGDAALQAAIDAITTAQAAQWTDEPHAATLFTADAGTWTVPTTNFVYRWKRDGSTYTMAVRILASTLSSTPTTLLIALPPSIVATGRMNGAYGYLNNGVAGTGLWGFVPVAGATQIALFLNALGPAWVAAADTGVFLTATFEVDP